MTKTSAYRPDPEVGRAAAPLLWRPWMTRLATAAAVAASPALTVYAWAWALRRWPGEAMPPWWLLTLLVIFALQALLTGIVLSAAASEKGLTSGLALRVSWAAVVYPCIAAVRLARWIAYGDTI